MKKVHIEELKKLDNWYHLDVLNNTKDTLRYEYLKSLRKVHKLKNSNKILSAKRSYLYGKMITLTQKDYNTLSVIATTLNIQRLSEKMGKNSYKIMKLRTEYRQLESYYKIKESTNDN